MAKWTWTDDEVAEMAAEAHRAADAPDEPIAIAARYDRAAGRDIVDLDNETTFMFPARLAEGLAEADPDLLAQVAITPNGDGLRWEALNADLGLQGLLMGCLGGEAWMRRLHAERGRKGGASSSAAKAQAARENGKRGGRPKKSKQA